MFYQVMWTCRSLVSSALLHPPLTRCTTFHTFRRAASILPSHALQMSFLAFSTLYTGVRDESEEVPGSPLVSRNLGEAYEVKSEVEIYSSHGRKGITPKKEGRSFDDALRVLGVMSNQRHCRSLDNLAVTQRLVDQLGLRPTLEKISFVHIAGTKGKGTSAAYVAALLHGYGFKVGLFTSPHLIDVRERIMISNRLLSKNTFARYFFELQDRLLSLRFSKSECNRDAASRSSFFRFLFLLCLHIFAAEQVEVGVMEVGIGGRIDCTNVIPARISILTALGYDHMDILGNTLQEIAQEKAGIMKSGVLCFAAPQRDHPETRAVLEAAARKAQAPLIFLDDEIFPIKSWPKLSIGGRHAIENSKLAFLATRQIAGIPPVLPLDEMERGVLRDMTFSGRSQVIPIGDGRDCVLYLDGAHTPESVAHATEWFLESSAINDNSMPGSESDDADSMSKPRRVLLFYTSRDPHLILKSFMPFVSKFCKVVIAQVPTQINMTMTAATQEITAATPHASEDYTQQARERLIATTECWRSMYREVPCLACPKPFCSLEEILNLVIPAASESEDASRPAQVFVCGSFYIVGNVLQLLRQYEMREQCIP